MNGHGNGSFHGEYAIPGAADKVKSELASGQISQQEADGIPVSVSYVGTAKGFGQGQAGDPTVQAVLYENNPIGIRLWTFEATQSFNYSNNSVTWLSALSWSGTSVSYPWWAINNKYSSTSSPPTGVWHTQTYADVVYQYCPVWVLCIETSYAEAWLNYYGNGAWSWNGDWYNSF